MFKVEELIKAVRGRLISGLASGRVRGISLDSRTIKKEEAFVAIKGNNFDGHDFIAEAVRKGATCVIQESKPKARSSQLAAPRLPKIAVIEVKDTIKALGDVAQFHRQKFNLPVIAVTGSNGKTTAKEMIAWILSKNFKVLKNEGTKNNHIGVPLTLLRLNASDDLVVLELGTSHFGEIDYLAKISLPNIGVITNIGPSHLEFFRNLSGVFKEKYVLIENLKHPHIAILNADDDRLKKKIMSKDKKVVSFSFGMKNQSDFSVSDIKHSAGRLEFSVNSKYRFTLRTLGGHNIYNALIAVALARIFGMGYKDIARRLSCFEFPVGRFNLIRFKNISFIDDTYNSNPLSLGQALKILNNLRITGRKILVMGDMLELGNAGELFHMQAGHQIIEVCNSFISVGNLSRLAAASARSHGFNARNIFTCNSVREARDILFDKIAPKKDDLVLVKGSRAMRMEEIFK